MCLASVDCVGGGGVPVRPFEYTSFGWIIILDSFLSYDLSNGCLVMDTAVLF